MITQRLGRFFIPWHLIESRFDDVCRALSAVVPVRADAANRDGYEGVEYIAVGRCFEDVSEKDGIPEYELRITSDGGRFLAKSAAD